MQVGGLRDTVQHFNPYENTGTGWTFEWADGGNFRCSHPTSLGPSLPRHGTVTRCLALQMRWSPTVLAQV